jgi:hypothetical protein
MCGNLLKVAKKSSRLPVQTTSILAPLTLAAAGIAVAIRFNDSDERWVAALVGWAIGWFFALVAIAAWEQARGRPVFGQPGPAQQPWHRWEFPGLVLLLAAATFLRVVALERYPILLHNDEMSCLLEARGFIGADTALFDVGWFSCPNFGFFLTSIPVRLLGPSLLTLRLTSVFLGLLSLIATYLIVRRFFGVRPALLLLVLTTPFHWHLHFSRTGFHYMQAVSLTSVALLVFVFALDRRSPVLFGCAGVITGIAWQTYYAAWLVPFLLAAWLTARLLSDREDRSAAIRGMITTVVLFLVTVAPLFAHYLEEPVGATHRATGVFLFSENNREHLEGAFGTSDPLLLLTTQAKRLSRFFIGGAGDTAVQYGLQGRFVDPFLLPLFLGGLAYALTLQRRPGGQMLWIWFLGTVIAGGLLTIDAPFSPRLTGITTIVLLFPALLIDRILRIDWIRAKRSRSAVATLLFALTVALSGWWNLHTTFVRHPRTSRFEDRDFIVRLAADLGNVKTVANFGEPQDFGHQVYRALTPDVNGVNLSRSKFEPEDFHETVVSLGPKTLVIYPLGEEAFHGLCDQVESETAGVVLTRSGLVGIEWCFVE